MVLKDDESAKAIEYKVKSKTHPPKRKSWRVGLSTEFWWRERRLAANHPPSLHTS